MIKMSAVQFLLSSVLYLCIYLCPLFSFYKSTCRIGLESIHMTSFYFNYLLKCPFWTQAHLRYAELCPNLCHGLQYARFSVLHHLLKFAQKSCPLSQWCHSTILLSVVPFSSCPQSFLALGSFTVSQLFASGGQSIESSASASLLSVNIQGWFPLRFSDLTLLSKGLSKILEDIIQSITPGKKIELIIQILEKKNFLSRSVNMPCILGKEWNICKKMLIYMSCV